MVLGTKVCWNLLSPQLKITVNTAADVVRYAATYAYHLTQAHAFIDGNKRVAAAITETFLETNGARLLMTNGEIVQLFLEIASSALSRDQVEQILRERVRS